MASISDKTIVTASSNEFDESVGPQAGTSPTYDQRKELEELQAELRSLQRAVGRHPIPLRSPAVAGAPRTMREEVEYQIRLQPIASVALAAIVGFVYGIAR
ncbi:MULTISPECIES: hypothetical protein [Neorhizobium]|jgi:ElaB/YqjD/DUF883 family membrane-anchored ribosome-binding protein|uniref:hypothetical protein n=1 Tax=Neorhizobium sp. T6_25 TaxID=2093833 RepID=UPI000CF8FC82|nr:MULTISPECIES: hypothetical protein [Neorhizobium]